MNSEIRAVQFFGNYLLKEKLIKSALESWTYII